MTKFTISPASTYAIIVGIETYEAGPDWEIEGCTNDALRFTDWLLKQGVPPANLKLFVTTKNESFNSLKVRAPEIHDFQPTKGGFWNFIQGEFAQLHEQLPHNATLLFYWQGHGLIDEKKHRILLMHDMTHVYAPAIDLNDLQSKLFHEFPRFAEQIFFVDACASSQNIRGLESATPREIITNTGYARQYTLFSAQEGQTAKRGYFSETLLDILDEKDTSAFLSLDVEQLSQELHTRLQHKVDQTARQGQFASVQDIELSIDTPAHKAKYYIYAPRELQFLHPVTPEILQEAKKLAQEEKEEFKQSRQLMESNSEIDEYDRLVNEKALLGCPPQWHHLYLDEFGAFRRIEKENQILDDINKHIVKLAHKQCGLLLHVLSGDSGCGKSTLAKQILRRLVEHEQLQDYLHLQSQKLSIFELELAVIKQNQEIEKRLASIQASEKNVYIIYFDDLFALEEKEVDRILSILTSWAEEVPIYFFVTSPSWIFDRNRDLPLKKKNFSLVDSFETPIQNGLSKDDKQALKDQYIALYGSHCRPDLLKQIERADQDDQAIILLKLSLHHNMKFSEYLEMLLNRLEIKEPQYLAALLLFSLLARFYVHFPLPLLQLMNKELTGEKLPEYCDLYEYKMDAGLRLFRVRRGTRTSFDSSGMPDTLAPFHDRVAHVIYTTWGRSREVPLFKCTLIELKTRVYRKLQETPQTLLVLANVFRGHLRVADDAELKIFVDNYGPVQGNKWILGDVPIVAHRWIAYSRFNLGRTTQYRRKWENTLKNAIREHKDVGLAIALAFLNPNQSWEHMDRVRLTNLKHLGTDYFLLILGVLNQLLSFNPLPLEILGDYLSCLVEWLEAHPSTSHLSPTPCYLVTASLADSHLTKGWFSSGKNLAPSIGAILKTYLLNLDQEYKNRGVFNKNGLKILIIKTYWQRQDAIELSNSLFNFLQQGEDTTLGARLLEILFPLANIGNSISVYQIFQLFLDVCHQNADFSGLTYTASSFCKYLEVHGRKHPIDHKKFLGTVVSELAAGELHSFVKSAAYPNFIHDYIKQLIDTRYTILPSELFAMLRPLAEVDFGASNQIDFIFTKAVRINLSSTDFRELIHNNLDRQIQLCFAQKASLPLVKALDEFISLLEAGNFNLLCPSVILLRNYLKIYPSEKFASSQIELYRDRLYSWLEGHKASPEAPYIFTLLNAPTFFSFEQLKNLESLAIANIRLIPARLPHSLFPLEYIKFWLASEINHPSKQNRKVMLLDVFWLYILENCSSQPQKDRQTDKFIIYDEIFIPLVTQYPINQDETWWLKTLKTTIEYYNNPMSNIFLQQRQNKNNQIKEIIKKKRIDCLHKIINTILHPFLSNKSNSTDETLKSLRDILDQCQNQPWAIAWISQLNPEAQPLGTQALIDYLATLDPQTSDIFIIRNRFGWWVNWVKESKRDFSVEVDEALKKIAALHESRTRILALATLIECAGKYLVQTTHSIEIAFGPFVINNLEQRTTEFHDTSELVKAYLEYLKMYNLNDEKVLNLEYYSLRKIAIWYLKQAIGHSNKDFISYGLQTLFETLAKFEFDLDIKLAEEVFLLILPIYLDAEIGGPISRDYFDWLYKQSQPFDIQTYIDFIKTNQEGQQAPYLMLHFIGALDRASVQLTIETCSDYWQILKYWITFKLNNQSVTLASERFCKYFVKHCRNLAGGQEFLSQLSKEAFEVAQEMIDHNRIFFLVPGFLSVWHVSITYLLSREILHLWQTLLAKVQNTNNIDIIETFGMFTKDLPGLFETQRDASLLEEFYQFVLSFAEKNPRHKLSPKLCRLLCTKQAKIDQLADILPRLLYYQSLLEDVKYAIEKFYKYCSNSLEHIKRSELEHSLIAALNHNIGKPFAEKCLIEILKRCQPKIYYLEISQLFKAYLTAGKEPERTKDDYEYWVVFKSYRKYQKGSEVEPESIRQDLIDYLAIMQNAAKKPMTARYLDAILGTWPSQDISLPAATEALKAILLEINPQRWQRIINLCKKYVTLFGESVLLAPNISLQDVQSSLEKDEQQGLILIRQNLRPYTLN